MALRVEEVIDGTDIVTRVLHGGPLTSRKGINAPRVQLSANVPTSKDRRDIELWRWRLTWIFWPCPL